MNDRANDRLLTPDELEAELRAIGAVRYHHLHPFHRLLHGGKLTAAAGPGLGAQPLLLPGDDPDQGRARAQPSCRPRSCAANGAGASSTMTAIATGHRRHRALAEARRRRRARPRLCAIDRGHPAGHALRGRSLRELRARPADPRRHRLVADRDVLARHHRRPGAGHAGELRLHHRGNAGLFHAAADPGAAGRRLRAALRQGRGAGRAPTRRRCWRRCASSATCCGRSSTRSISPMSIRA